MKGRTYAGRELKYKNQLNSRKNDILNMKKS